MDGRNFLILSDLDGTIVPMGLPISAENIAAVTRMEGEGVVFSIATGRSPEAAMGYVKDLPVNGASLFSMARCFTTVNVNRFSVQRH